MQTRTVLYDNGIPVAVRVSWTVTVDGNPVSIIRTFKLSPHEAYDFAGQACAIKHARLVKSLYKRTEDVPVNCEPVRGEDVGERETKKLTAEERKRLLEKKKQELEQALKELENVTE